MYALNVVRLDCVNLLKPCSQRYRVFSTGLNLLQPEPLSALKGTLQQFPDDNAKLSVEKAPVGFVLSKIHGVD